MMSANLCFYTCSVLPRLQQRKAQQQMQQQQQLLLRLHLRLRRQKQQQQPKALLRHRQQPRLRPLQQLLHPRLRQHQQQKAQLRLKPLQPQQRLQRKSKNCFLCTSSIIRVCEFFLMDTFVFMSYIIIIAPRRPRLVRATQLTDRDVLLINSLAVEYRSLMLESTATMFAQATSIATEDSGVGAYT
jgi:hypothetical protein